MTVTDTRQAHHKESILEERFLGEHLGILDGDLVMLGATEGVVTPATANAVCTGVAVNAVTAADITAFEAGTVSENSIEVNVMTIGLAPVLAGGQIAAGASVISDANGRVVQATGDGTDNIIGICRHATAADGDATYILINHVPATD